MTKRINSDQQAQITRLLREGVSQRRIALLLGCSPKTVLRWVKRLGLKAGGGCVGVAALARRLGVSERTARDLLPMLARPTLRGGRRTWSEVEVRRMQQFLSAYQSMFPRWKRAYVRLLQSGRRGDVRRICEFLSDGCAESEVAELIGVPVEWVKAVGEVVELRGKWLYPPLDESSGKEVFGRKRLD